MAQQNPQRRSPQNLGGSPTVAGRFPDFSVPFHGQPFSPPFDGTSLSSPTTAVNPAAYGPLGRGSISNVSDHRLSVGDADFAPEAVQNGDAGDADVADDDGRAGKAEDKGHASEQDDKVEPPPPWHEMKTKAGKDRKRLPLACIACRRKKIRCSGEKPACKHCLRSRVPCLYKVTTRKAAPRTDYMAMMEKRLKRMEERVIKLIPKDAAAVPRAVVKPALPSALSPSGRPSNGGANRKRLATEAFGSELDEWARSKPHGSGGGDTFSTLPPRSEDAEERGLLTEGADCLPTKEIQEHLAEVYFDFLYGQCYYLLHKPSFMRKLAAGTVPPVLILAVCAISARFSNHPQVRTEPAFLRGEQWASKAREISLKRYDKPNITILIVYLLLGLHEFGTCQGGRSWMFGGMAQRMAYALQLHNDQGSVELSHTDLEIRRRTMWSCFIMDRFNSSGTDRPIFVNDQFISVQLPIKEHYFQMEIPGPTEDLDGGVPDPVPAESGRMSNPRDNMGVAAYLVRLVAIWGRIVKYMNFGGKDTDKFPMWDPQSTFHVLKADMQRFRASLPASLHWTKENLDNHVTEKTANQFLLVHIIYYQIILFMHCFALPSTAGTRPPRDMPDRFLHEAARAAIDAAKYISELIGESMHHRVVAPFAGYCAFFASTVHIRGVFSRNADLANTSKQYLASNVKYLSRMKKYWGMFHFVSENLKELYRQHADAAAIRARAAAGGFSRPMPRSASLDAGKESPTTRQRQGSAGIFQYGDWFDRYPHGVSRTDYEDPAAEIKKEAGTDAVLGQKSDLQSVEEFFASLSTPSKAEHRRKISTAANKKAKAQKGKDKDESSQPQQVQTTPAPVGPSPQEQTFPAPFPFHQRPQPQFSPSFDLPGVPPHQLQQLPQRPLGPEGVPPLDDQFALNNNFGSHDPMLMWNLDVSAALNSGLQSGDGHGLDPSTAWFMPFNMEPPEIPDDGSSAFGSAGGTGGPYNFGFSPAGAPDQMIGLEGLDDFGAAASRAGAIGQSEGSES
ncbi:fungal-specific transcription factor domain-containing protein [Lineolata rhizophorae]|uniref:Fungal-specific transcription factor domain-containing protein n=1 Tax=Lineolata rhizophorae TaxID=578093 RepID=A0A6A6NW75_9PEZI|nr:fungal-specific transcription factor domain-containing protein [Lineolata rhizophorae]